MKEKGMVAGRASRASSSSCEIFSRHTGPVEIVLMTLEELLPNRLDPKLEAMRWPYSFECLLLSPLGTLLSPSTKSTQWIQPFEFWILLIKKREKGHSPWIQPSDLPPPWEIEGDRLAFQLCLIVKDLIPIIIYWIRPVQLGIPLDVREREPQKIWKSKTYSPENSDWSYTATTEIPELIFSCYGTVNILWTSPGLDDYEKRFLWRNWVGRKGLPKGLNMVSLANGEITFSQKIACRSSCFS